MRGFEGSESARFYFYFFGFKRGVGRIGRGSREFCRVSGNLVFIRSFKSLRL